MPILKETETSKIRKGKAKANRKGKNLNEETSLWCKLKDVEKLVNSINKSQIRHFAIVEDLKKSQNLFYACIRAWNSSIVSILGQLSPSPLLEFLVFPPIIRSYDPSFSNDDLEDQHRSMASLPKEKKRKRSKDKN
ncbi:hypothetical protein PVK06_047244 [Gossypium arboreum]|uniref:Uncharacterized protein n=1 Tax=Gossypium arboreum TaxID=29729 RepID=A0ABR0MCT0_GOSAR|nr:hypothetical protein PVK06_047244 [Gossypium arboreum]